MPLPRKDPFGLDDELAAPSQLFDAQAVAPPLDVSLDVDAESGFTPASIDLPELPGEPELAPLHAFVPPAETTGHQPEPAAALATAATAGGATIAEAGPPAAAASGAAGADGGEVALREALSKASREVIERVVWEVVPQLAETIIRENLDRLVKQREG